MALPSGIFSSATPGRLQVTYSVQFRVGAGDRWAGGNTGGNQLVLKALLGDGAEQQDAFLSIGGPSSAFLEMVYPGGGLAVPVALIYQTHSVGSTTGFVRAEKCRITCVLIKR